MVEVDHPSRFVPAPLALEEMRRVLEQETRKEVVMLTPRALPDAERFEDPNLRWTASKILEIHRESFEAASPDSFLSNGTTFLHLIYLNGAAQEGDLEAAGIQIGHVLAYFPDAIVSYGTVPTAGSARTMPEYYERAFLVHELGHALGLVNHGVPMVRPHADTTGVHSSNPKSVMYRAVFHGAPYAPLERVQDNAFVPYRFDSDDKADLEAYRNLDASGQSPAAALRLAFRRSYHVH